MHLKKRVQEMSRGTKHVSTGFPYRDSGKEYQKQEDNRKGEVDAREYIQDGQQGQLMKEESTEEVQSKELIVGHVGQRNCTLIREGQSQERGWQPAIRT